MLTTNLILIADDDPDFLRIEQEFLVHAGYDVLCAKDAYHALHLATTEGPSLLLLDINMPAGNGTSVHERMRQFAAVKDTPVIYLTGDRAEVVHQTARLMDPFAIMYKPIDFAVLLTNIKGALRKHAVCTADADFSGQGSWVAAWSVAPAVPEIKSVVLSGDAFPFGR